MKFGKIFSLVAMLALVFALTLATGIIAGAEEATPAAVEEEITIEFTAPYKECGKIKLSWQSVSGADEYRIYLNDEHVATSLVNYYIKSKLDVADYGQAEILYNFKVEAVDVNGNIIAAGTVDAFGKHVWDNGTVTTAPTCSALGLMTYTCEGCGNNTYTEDIAIDPAAHLYDSGVITTAPNCTEKGVKTFTCQYDGTHTYTEDVDALGHTFVNYVSNNDATCQADGTETATCEDCTVTDTRTDVDSKLPHEYFYACDAHCMNCYELTNPAAQHTLTHVDAVAPTCQSTGNIEYYICNHCGTAWDNENATGMPLNRYTVIVPKADHEYLYACDAHCMNCYELTNPDAQHTATKVDAVAPTCTANGNVEYYVCSICNGHWLDAELTQNSNPRNVVVPKLPHEYFFACDAHCMNCGELTNPDAQHTATKVDAVAPTCQADGNVEYYVCSICNGHWLDAGLTQNSNPRNVVVPKAPHEYLYACDAHCMNCYELTNPDAQHTATKVDAVAPTCTANGNVEYYVCSICNGHWLDADLIQNTNPRNVVVPMAPHEYLFACDAHCMNCGNLTNPDAQHTATKVDAVAPTCQADGNVEYYVCSICNGHWLDADLTQNSNPRNVVVPKVDHEYFYACDAHCMNCGELTNPDAQHTLTHVDAVAPTCTENGNVEYYICNDCGTAWDNENATGMPLNRYTVIVPTIDHAYDAVVTDPTCTENGYTTYTCTMCSDSYTDDVTSATGHEPGEATKETVTAATCTENGLYYDVYYCVDCGVEIHRESQTENALGHNFSDATCTAPKTCTRCSETDGSALGHNYTEATCTEAAQCTRCNQKKGSALGHDLTDATCTEGQTCKVCGLTSNNALGHSFVADENSDSFEIYEYCQICGEQGELSGYQLPEKYKDIIIKVAVVLGSTIVIVLCVRALRRPATTTPWYKRRRK